MSDDDDLPHQQEEPNRPAVTISDAERQILDVKPPKTRKESVEDRAKRERREEDGFWKSSLDTLIGRRACWRLLHGHESAHAFNQDFAISPNGFPDPNAAWYERGKQDFGLNLYHRWLVLNAVGVGKMHQENDPRFAVKGE